MIVKRRLRAAAIAGLIVAGAAADERRYRLTTASRGGAYYPVGVAIADLAEATLRPTRSIAITVVDSPGSIANIQRLRESEADFAILGGMTGAFAWIGEDFARPHGRQTHLRAVAMLWPNVEQFMILRSALRSGTIADLAVLKGRGAPVAMGLPKSGARHSSRVMLASVGIALDDDFELLPLGYDAAAKALEDGRAVAANFPAGAPTSAVTQAFSALGENVALLSITDAQIAAANRTPRFSRAVWTPHRIEAGVYPGQDAPIQTAAQTNFLAVHEDVGADAVYWITRMIFENLPTLRAAHPALQTLAVARALDGLPVPLHPGARRYFRERDVFTPSALAAAE